MHASIEMRMEGRTREEWPTWPQVADEEGRGREWRPGDRWPKGWPRDEHLFLITHQAFELWFKQILHDLDGLLDDAVACGREHGEPLPRWRDESPGEYPTLTSNSLRLFPRLERAKTA